MSYNLTQIGDNSTGLLGFIQVVNNELMLGLFGILLLIALAVIMFMAFVVTTQDGKKAFVATTFLSFVFAIFLKMMGLVPNLAIFTTLVLAAGSIAFSYMGKDD